MIDGSEKRNRQLAFERPNSHVCEKRSNDNFDILIYSYNLASKNFPKPKELIAKWPLNKNFNFEGWKCHFIVKERNLGHKVGFTA